MRVGKGKRVRCLEVFFPGMENDAVVVEHASARFGKNATPRRASGINGAEPASNIIFTVCRNRKVPAFNTPI